MQPTFCVSCTSHVTVQPHQTLLPPSTPTPTSIVTSSLYNPIENCHKSLHPRDSLMPAVILCLVIEPAASLSWLISLAAGFFLFLLPLNSAVNLTLGLQKSFMPCLTALWFTLWRIPIEICRVCTYNLLSYYLLLAGYYISVYSTKSACVGRFLGLLVILGLFVWLLMVIIKLGLFIFLTILGYK